MPPRPPGPSTHRRRLVFPEGIRMFPKMVRASKGLWREVQDITRRGRDVWQLVPSGQKRSLFGAVLVMAGWAGATTAIPLILRNLFIGLELGVKQGLDRATLFRLSLGS